MRDKILLALFMVFIGFSGACFAGDEPLPLNQVALKLVKEQWATTNTAKVIVNVAAILDKTGLSRTHKGINAKLHKISKTGTWHITQFNRYKDPSGLEKLNVRAEARVPEGELPGLRDRAKSVSRAGEKYTIATIQFTPSLADVERTRQDVRNQIFKAANDELARLNKVFGSQKYFLHSINFIPGLAPMPRQVKAQSRMMMSAEAVSDSGVTVSDKVTLKAVVIFASINKKPN